MVGIYKITSPSGRIYIGQSRNINKRFTQYKRLACEKQPRLYNSFIKYGINDHTFEIIEKCEVEQLNIRERYYQDLYDVLNKGLNLVLTETDILPRVYTKEALEHCRKINLGKNNPMFGKKGILNSKSKKVIDTENNKIYHSLNECCEINNLNPKNMSRWLNGSRPNKTKYKYL